MSRQLLMGSFEFLYPASDPIGPPCCHYSALTAQPPLLMAACCVTGLSIVSCLYLIRGEFPIVFFPDFAFDHSVQLAKISSSPWLWWSNGSRGNVCALWLSSQCAECSPEYHRLVEPLCSCELPIGVACVGGDYCLGRLLGNVWEELRTFCGKG